MGFIVQNAKEYIFGLPSMVHDSWLSVDQDNKTVQPSEAGQVQKTIILIPHSTPKTPVQTGSMSTMSLWTDSYTPFPRLYSVHQLMGGGRFWDMTSSPPRVFICLSALEWFFLHFTEKSTHSTPTDIYFFSLPTAVCSAPTPPT